MFGGFDDDTLLGGAGNDVLEGFEDNDSLNGGDGNDTLDGGDGNDRLNGEAGADSINGSYGDDTIDAGVGNDTVEGGDGNDSISAGDGNDFVYGDFGNDTINAGAGDDSIDAGDGNDSIVAGDGNDIIDAGGDDDVVNAGNGADSVFASAGDDTVDGGAGDDTIDGGDGYDSLVGGAGNDMIEGGEDSDTINGGDGSDTLDGGEGNDSVRGGAGDDYLSGSGGNDKLFGEDGNDTLEGGEGNDSFEGGAGNDLFIGGEGTDTVVYYANKSSYDLSVVGGQLRISSSTVGADLLEEIEIVSFAGREYSYEELYTAAEATSHTELRVLLQSPGKYALSQIKTGPIQADDTATMQVVKFDGIWSLQFRADAKGLLLYYQDPNSPAYNPGLVPLSLDQALQIIDSGLTGRDSEAFVQVVGIVADAAIINGKLSLDDNFIADGLERFTEWQLRVAGVGKFTLTDTMTTAISANSASLQVVKVDGFWTTEFKQKAFDVLSWYQDPTSSGYNPGLVSLTLEQGLALIDNGLATDREAYIALIGLICDAAIVDGKLITDNIFGT
ncbi:MAG: calcium-binding protein [Actinobacteria bacterium]|nr:calcium-binding protein [Actinomycetota bacterium]